MMITDSVKYVGTDDIDIDLFESQYTVPKGVSYNSYVIMDEKAAVMDTVDKRKTDEWLDNLEKAMEGRTPDYLVISHLEPDHGGSIGEFCKKYPKATLVVNDKSLKMLNQFVTAENETIAVKEGDELNLGEHTLVFYMAPMVHWPEVMVEYEKRDKILFSADGFGKFGALSNDEDWTDEARRYYINIVGKYGVQVQNLLKKAAGLDIEIICPLHGPVLKENLGYYMEKYNIWSSYQAEEKGVCVAYASIHGNTGKAAEIIKKKIEERGIKAELYDLARCDMAEAVSSAFKYDSIVLAAATYDGYLFPPMEKFLLSLKKKNYQKRKAALVENGTWAPVAAKLMKEILEGMKDITVCESTLTVKSVLREDQMKDISTLVEEITG